MQLLDIIDCTNCESCLCRNCQGIRKALYALFTKNQHKFSSQIVSLVSTKIAMELQKLCKYFPRTRSRSRTRTRTRTRTPAFGHAHTSTHLRVERSHLSNLLEVDVGKEQLLVVRVNHCGPIRGCKHMHCTLRKKFAQHHWLSSERHFFLSRNLPESRSTSNENKYPSPSAQSK